jgi:hypothetical protein
MMTAADGTVWGVQWEEAVPPEGAIPGDQPQAPGPDADDEAKAAYGVAINEWQRAVLDLIAIHPEWWQTLTWQANDEDTARRTYVELLALESGNPYRRNTTLVNTEPRVWTPVE